MTASGLRKFHETDGYGRLARSVYVTDPAALPPPHQGTEWKEDLQFDEAKELRDNSTLRIVFEEAHKHGFAVVE